MKYFIKSAEFTVRSDKLRGDLYMPESDSKPPVLVMGHGFGGLRKFVLPSFAERFVDAGMAVLLFDYRGFGDSEGSPRSLVDAKRHLEDFGAAIDYAKTLPEIDASRIALWGTSFAGGHVLTIASRRKDIAAAVAQVPHVDGLASSLLFPFSKIPQAMYLAITDSIASTLGRSAVTIPIVSETGIACLISHDSYEGYKSLIPEDCSLKDYVDVPARIMLTVGTYRPVAEANNIKAPVLIVAAEKDTLIPLWAVRRTAKKIKDCRLELLPVGHFELYKGEYFEKNILMQIDFLKEKLGII
ncbi:alpha/beta hydrolase [Desulforegula conservatrix]|uniref:alpha/beta hydrolase n=1 Tax=Desulforegula conservatrix TaxID=153026 RepID=UPI0003FBF74F|nr:alpha/beta fold hydrolase [Desulforegula conservatrix]